MSDTIHDLEIDDFVMVVVDGCIKKITKEDFLNGLIFPGNSTCEMLQHCIGDIGEYNPPIHQDTPPEISDIEFFIDNGVQNYEFGEVIPNHYFDNDGDALGYIQIIGGDITGVHLNGTNIMVGQIINAVDLDKLKINTKNQTQSYQQVVYFDAFDVNNVKALQV